MKLHPVFDEQKYADNRKQFLVDVKYCIDTCLKELGTSTKHKRGREISKVIMATMHAFTEDPVFWVASIRDGDTNELVNWMK